MTPARSCSVDLSRAGGDNAWLFGGLVIARYYVDALGRQSLPPSERVPHTLYVDEVQNFDTSALCGTTGGATGDEGARKP